LQFALRHCLNSCQIFVATNPRRLINLHWGKAQPYSVKTPIVQFITIRHFLCPRHIKYFPAIPVRLRIPSQYPALHYASSRIAQSITLGIFQLIRV
jgi:hypothetical protein